MSKKNKDKFTFTFGTEENGVVNIELTSNDGGTFNPFKDAKIPKLQPTEFTPTETIDSDDFTIIKYLIDKELKTLSGGWWNYKLKKLRLKIGRIEKTYNMTKQEKKNSDAVLAMQKTLIYNIYKACKENAGIFEVNYVPVTFVDLMGDTAISSLSNSLEVGKKSLKEGKEKTMVEVTLHMSISAVNKIKELSAKSAKEFNVDYVPVKILKTICDNVWSTLATGWRAGFGN